MRVGFLNAFGLTQDKFDRLSQLIGPALDILFVCETWHIPIRPSPLVHMHTPPSSHRVTGHQNGGLVVLVSHRFQPIISASSCDSFHIRLQFQSLCLVRVYAPPSLPIGAF